MSVLARQELRFMEVLVTLSDHEKERISQEEKFRAEMREQTNKEIQARDVQEKNKKYVKGCIGYLVFCLVLSLVFSFFGSNKEEVSCNSDNGMALVMAQQFVEQRLKAPSSAGFPWGTRDSQINNIGGCVYVVTSYVDAQNSFGAKIRTNYIAKVKYVGNDEWIPLNIELNQ
jgi:hypothetical protein